MSNCNFDDEIAAILFIWAIGFFLHAQDAGQIRPLFQSETKLIQKLRRANGENFDAAIAAIAHEAIDLHFSGDMLDVIAKANPLHTPGNNIPTSQKVLSRHSDSSLTKRTKIFPVGRG
jgi:hypothetical protein